ncbi:UNVERIFIED_CONTAM: hypothetical protein FKN15_015971 [Acipenser sinensis]
MAVMSLFTKRRSKRGSSSAYDQSLSDSSSHSLDKHHDNDKKKHKERDKHKPKHKKSAPGLVPPAPALVHSLTVTTEKSYTSTSGGSSMPGSLKRLEETTARFTNANFQEVPTHPTSGKDGGVEVKVGGEGKGKKAAGHSTGQKGRKPGAGRTPVGVTVTAATSTSPFQQGAVLGMLKSLHQLQMENRRLEEQIRTLTAKKERLQLLSAQLSVPFPSSAPNPSASSQMQVFAAQPGICVNLIHWYHIHGKPIKHVKLLLKPDLQYRF